MKKELWADSLARCLLFRGLSREETERAAAQGTAVPIFPFSSLPFFVTE